MFSTEIKTKKMAELESQFADLDKKIKDAQLSKGLRGTKPVKNAISRRSRIKKQWLQEWLKATAKPENATLDDALESLGKTYKKSLRLR